MSAEDRYARFVAEKAEPPPLTTSDVQLIPVRFTVPACAGATAKDARAAPMSRPTTWRLSVLNMLYSLRMAAPMAVCNSRKFHTIRCR